MQCFSRESIAPFGYYANRTMRFFSKVFFFVALLFSGWAVSSCDEAGQTEGVEQEDNGGSKPSSVVVELLASSSLIIADGEDELVLTVKYDSLDVTDSASVYVNKKRMNGNLFVTDVPGDYEFFASYKGKVSNSITIKVANPELYANLPEDDQPEKFSNFDRNILIGEATGTWCGACPYMIRALELFEEKGSNADKAVIVAFHSDDELSSDASEALVHAMGMYDYPSCILNLNPDVLILGSAQPELNAENFNALVGMELKEAARVGIATTTKLSADESVVGVRAAVKVGKDGNYRINVWLIEDGVSADQSSYWEEFSDGKAVIAIDHKHILRDASCVSPVQGSLLGDNGLCVAGETVEFYHEFDVAKAGVEDIANCKIAVLVSTVGDNTSKRYLVNNIVECNVGESISFGYK